MADQNDKGGPPKPGETSYRFATPFGVQVDVYRNEESNEDESYLFSTEATLTMMGVHDPAVRAKCIALIKANPQRMFDVAFENGGMKRRSFTINPPEKSCYADMPEEIGDIDGPNGVSIRKLIDNWVTEVSDQRRWFDRSAALLRLCEGQMQVWDTYTWWAGAALCGIVSSVLEHLGETEIDCLEAAAFYAISKHQQWREAGRDWLMPVRKTWLPDWVNARPTYRKMVKLIGKSETLPTWLIGASH